MLTEASTLEKRKFASSQFGTELKDPIYVRCYVALRGPAGSWNRQLIPRNTGLSRLIVSCAPSVAPDGNALEALGADGGLGLRDRVGGGGNAGGAGAGAV